MIFNDVSLEHFQHLNDFILATFQQLNCVWFSMVRLSTAA